MPSDPEEMARTRLLAFELSLNELIFYRSWVEGTFKLQFLIDRYLPPGTRAADARRILRKSQAALVAASRRANKHGQARLLLLDDTAARANPGPQPGFKRRRTHEAVSPQPSAQARAKQPAPEGSPQLVPGQHDLRPSFDHFVAEKDPNGDFSLQELEEIYTAEYGALPSSDSEDQNRLLAVSIPVKATSLPDARATDDMFPPAARNSDRHSKLVKRRLALISELMPLLTRAPQLDDEVDAWWDNWVAGPLLRAGVTTLGMVINLLNEFGPNWHQCVPKLGVVRATSCIQWLRNRGSAIADRLSPYADVPRFRLPRMPYGVSPVRHRSKAIAGRLPNHSLEECPAPYDFTCVDGLFNPPQSLDGSEGSNRAPRCRSQLSESTDHAAVIQWLECHGRGQNSHTYRAYRTAAERLLLWCYYVRKVPLSSLDASDLKPFADFLLNPQPRALWVSDRPYPRYSSCWRPFVIGASRHQTGMEMRTGLSRTSARQTLSVLSGLGTWLVAQEYLLQNPFSGATRVVQAGLRGSRILTDDAWAILLVQHEDTRDTSVRGQRLKFALQLAASTDIRLNEMSLSNLEDLVISLSGCRVESVALRISGSRGRTIRLPAPVAEALIGYLCARGIEIGKPLKMPLEPLVSKLYETQATWRMTPNALHKLFVGHFQRVASHIGIDRPDLKAEILSASASWLRGKG